MFQIGTPWEGGSEARALAAIPETGPKPDQAAAAAAERVRLVGCCTTFLLGVSAPFSRMTWALPAGAALSQTPNPTRNPGCAPSSTILSSSRLTACTSCQIKPQNRASTAIMQVRHNHACGHTQQRVPFFEQGCA